MKIWILEIGEPLPLEADVRLHRYGQFSRALASFGHDVTWWTSSFSHAAKKHVVERDVEIVESGVNLHFVRGPGYSRNISLARIQHQKHFANEFLARAASKPKPDLIFAPVPTVDGAKAAVAWGKANGVPVIVDVRDLWPDELVDLAPSPARWLARLLLRRSFNSMREACRGADAIFGVSPSYLNYGLSFAGREKTKKDLVFPLGYSEQPLDEEKKLIGRKWLEDSGIRKDVFTVCFFGTIGQFFDLSTVIRAARILRSEMGIQFVLAGAGSRLEQYRKEAADVPEVIFPGWLDAPKIRAVMEVSDVGLAPYEKDAKMEFPNKPFEYMSAGLPLISSLKGEMAELIESSACGINYVADDAGALCDALRRMAADSESTSKMGRAAESLWRTRFRTEAIFEQVDRHIREHYGRGK